MGHAGSEYLDIQRRDSVRRQRRHALGREFAQRHRQQSPGRAVANDAAELAIEQFPHRSAAARSTVNPFERSGK